MDKFDTDVEDRTKIPPKIFKTHAITNPIDEIIVRNK
jgi:hypothetical protein